GVQTCALPIYASVKPYAYDPNRAKALLAEAGFQPGPDGVLVKDGKRFSFSIRHDQANPTVKDTAVIVQEYLKRVGVEATMEPLDWPTFVKKLFASEFEAIVVNWTNHHDPDPFAYTIWHSSQWKGRNFAHYKIPRCFRSISASVFGLQRSVGYGFGWEARARPQPPPGKSARAPSMSMVS